MREIRLDGNWGEKKAEKTNEIIYSSTKTAMGIS